MCDAVSGSKEATRHAEARETKERRGRGRPITQNRYSGRKGERSGRRRRKGQKKG